MPRNKVFLYFLITLYCSLIFLFIPCGAYAGHEGPEDCYNCHSLDEDNAVDGTSFIDGTANTYPEMETANGGLAPSNFGCTFCHSTSGNVMMRNALDHFDVTRASKHPVGFNYDTDTDTDSDLTSTVDTAPISFEIRCIDCHDPAILTIPNHQTAANGGTWDQVNNPYGLRNVTVAGAYDDLCRACHGATPTGTWGNPSVPVSLHADGTSAVAGDPGTIEEDDGTPLRTTTAANVTAKTQCGTCHSAHYSGTNARLLSAAAMQNDAVTNSNCTSVCHFRGDAQNMDFGGTGNGGNYMKYGHGKAQSTYKYSGGVVDMTNGNSITMNYSCTACHVPIDPAVKPHVEAPTGGTIQENYKAKFNINPNLQSWDTGSDFGNPLVGVCYSCHAAYQNHSGAGGLTGCQDCHDEHAENSGSGSNVFMIPETSKPVGNYVTPTKTKDTTNVQNYDQAALTAPAGEADFLCSDGAGGSLPDGICDNASCHAAASWWPASNVFADHFGPTGNHTGGVKEPGSDCNSCHVHTGDPEGSFGGSESCTTCHGQPPSSLATMAPNYDLDDDNPYHETRTPHARHAKPPANGGYGFSCKECHANFVGDTHDTDPTKTYESVWFLQTTNPSTTAYPVNPPPDLNPSPDYNEATATCSNLYCHSDGATSNSTGSQQWMVSWSSPDWTVQNLFCDACHGDGDNNGAGRSYPLDVAGNHTRHVATLGAGCEHCHNSTTPDGTTINLTGQKHVDGNKDVTGGSTFNGQTVSIGGYDPAPANRTCTNVSCHNGGSASWNDTTLDCSACHARTTLDGGDVDDFIFADSTAAMVDSDEWTTAGHGAIGIGVYDSGNDGANLTCAACHDASVPHEDGSFANANPFRLKKPALPVSGTNSFDDATDPQDDNNLCLDCHSTSGNNAASAVKHVDENHFGTKHIGTETAGGSFCWDCHDPHGDTDDYMMHSGDGSAPGRGVTDASDGVYGIPATSRPVTQLDVTSGTPLYASEDLANNNNTGLCQTCHQGTGAGADFYDRDTFTPLASHNGADTQLCTNCHDHTGDFAASCTGCHGGGLAAEGNSNYWPDSESAGHGTTWPNRLGKHGGHVTRIAEVLFATSTPSTAQKNGTCDYCHPGGNHSGDQAAAPADLMDGTATHFKDITGGTDSGETVTQDPGTDATWDTVDDEVTCANVNCHYNNPMPATEWLGASTANCEYCHFYRDGGSYPTNTFKSYPSTLPNAHLAHVAGIPPWDVDQSKSYLCSYCHGIPVQNNHQNGAVDLDFTAAPNEPGNVAAAQTGSDLALKYGGAGAYATCSNFYCHGDDFSAATQGIDTTPVWNDHTTGTCGDCHDVDLEQNPAFKEPLAQGKHGVHMAMSSGGVAYGPGISSHYMGCATCHGMINPYNPADPPSSGYCVGCHNPGTLMPGDAGDEGYVWAVNRSHVEGNFQVDFEDQDRGWNDFTDFTGNPGDISPGTISPIGTAFNDGTDICNQCHSTADISGVGGTLAKQNWETPAYRLPCLNCHNGTDPASNLAVTSGRDAPDMLGDGVNSGAEARGHNRTGTDYPITGNPAAGLSCSDCHDENSTHVNTADDTTFSGNRLRADVNGGAGISDVTSLCRECHANAAGTIVPVKSSINTHSNVDYGSRLEGATFSVDCEQCHEPHGMVSNGTGYNIYMINPTITVTAGVTVSGVRFEGLTGDYSFNDTLGTEGDDICAVCHTHVNNPGQPMTYNADGAHAAPAYTNDERGSDCSTCHTHNQDNDVLTADGLMPGACTGCHGGGLLSENYENYWPDSQAVNGTSWPNRAGGGTVTATHTKHVNRIATVVYGASPTTAQKNATCDWCHPTGGHTGDATDHANPPATLMDGTTHVFKNIAGSANLRTSTVTQGPGVDTVWDDPAPSDDEVTCSNVDCHYTRTMGAADWHSNPPQSSCIYCHGDQATYSPGDLPNAHDRHVGEYAQSCNTCHPAWGGTFNHQDGVVNIEWTIPGPEAGDRLPVNGDLGPAKFGGGTAVDYTTCSGLTCHGDWDDTGIGFKGGNNYAANWFNTQAVTPGDPSDWDGRCGTCHGDATLVTEPNNGGDDTDRASPRSGNYSDGHTAHVNSNTNPDCGACHFDALGTNGTYGNPATHADRSTINIAFDPLFDYEESAVTNPLYDNGGTETCSDVRCHNGAVTPTYVNPTSISCGDCHGSGSVETADARPQGASVAGLHAAHAVEGDADWTGSTYSQCDNCHGDATDSVSGSRGTAFTATGGSSIHQNLSVDVYMDSGSGSYTDAADTAGGVNWNAAGATHVDDGACSATVCHDNDNDSGTMGTTLAWNTAYDPSDNCIMCHGNGTDGVDDVAGADSIDDQWVTDGHGSVDGGDLDASTSTDVGGCDFCHLDDVWADHLPVKGGTNPYRLHTIATDNTVCLNCHDVSGDSGYDPPGGVGPETFVDSSKDIDDTHFGSKHVSGEGGTFCWDCHDPHGVPANILMVKTELSKTSDTYGLPAETVTTGTAFTARAAATDFVNLAAASGFSNPGVCQACHDSKAGLGDVKYYRNDGTEDNNEDDVAESPAAGPGTRHNDDQVCTDCHTHPTGFGAGCTDCHGGGLAAEGNNNHWPDSEVGGHGSSWPNQIGKHGEHVTRIAEVLYATATPTTAEKNATCGYCHPKGGHTGDQVVAPADLVPANVSGTDYWFKDVGGDDDTPGTSSQSGGNVTCTNACHYNRAMPDTDWYGTPSMSCEYCHDYTIGTYDEAASNALPNAHEIHVDDMVDLGYALGCGTCHVIPGGAEWDHQDDVIDLSTANWPNEEGTPDAAATPGTATDPKYGTGTVSTEYTTCSNLYCHGDFDSVAFGGGKNASPNWFNTDAQIGAGLGDGRCGTCHDGNGTGDLSVVSSGNHTDHLSASYGPVFGDANCGNCHTGFTGAAGTHVDGAIQFANVDTGTFAFSTLGTTVGPPISTNTDRCDACHSTATVNSVVGVEAAKTNWSNSSYTLDCLNCHNGTDPGNTQADGLGTDAMDVNTTWTDNGHGSSFIASPVTCDQCHDLGVKHVNIISTDNNPWRLLASTNYTAGGGLDAFCANPVAGCHVAAAPMDHAFNVAQSEAKEGEDTHPTATPITPDDRWFVDPSVTGIEDLPLSGDLTEKDLDNDPGHEILCVTCHDPHGVDDAAIPTRTFSGANTEGAVPDDGQMTRYNFTTGTPPELCGKCHK